MEVALGRLAPTVLLALLAIIPARASRIVYADLDEVVDDAELVFRARVMSYQQTRTQGEIRGEYEVEIAGAPDVYARLHYAENTPRRSVDAQGQEIWEWPQVTGSGLENGVQVGQTYLFIARTRSGTPAPLELLRVEPMEREPLVMSVWRMSLFRRMATPIELPVAQRE